MPSDVDVDIKVLNLVAAANLLMGSPPIVSHNNVEEDLKAFLRQEGKCQLPTGSDDVCGLPYNSPVHTADSTYGHSFVSNARVAQPVEQGFRKAEVVGSTPISSSTSLNDNQRDKLATVVYWRTLLETDRRELEKLEQESAKAKSAYLTQEASRQNQLALRKSQVDKRIEGLIKAEHALRMSILEDVVVNGKAKFEEEKSEEPPVDNSEDLGRAE
jgi:hypothetical protein